MADSDSVTWGDLKTFCGERRAICRDHLAQREANEKLQWEAGISKFTNLLEVMSTEVKGLKKLLENAWVLPKPIFVLIVVSAIGVGVAGEKVITLLFKHFGGGQ